jgi:hypothetical protein
MTRPARTVREVLIAAKWILEHVGWCQGYFSVSSNGKCVGFCSTGAIHTVHAKPSLIAKTMLVMQGITTFNDEPSTTLPMVLARFDEAIARAK